VCYAHGGTRPTVTDAALTLGYIDPDFFLGGSMKLDLPAAQAAIARDVAEPLGLALDEAAAAMIAIATENMVQAILDITVNQGIDPREAVLLGGGGAAGLNSVLIARRLESPRLLIPEAGAALSAAGALMSDLTAQFHATLFTRGADFDFAGVNAVLDGLDRRARAFVEGPGRGAISHTVTFWAEARYPEQVWELEVKLPRPRFNGAADVAALTEAFHRAHQEVFAIHDANSGIEIVGWSVSVACRIRGEQTAKLAPVTIRGVATGERMAYFPGHGRLPTALRRFEGIAVGEKVAGPAIIESSFTTVVVNPGAVAERRPSGSLSVDPGRG
jgi:N-methylhydantoinase A